MNPPNANRIHLKDKFEINEFLHVPHHLRNTVIKVLQESIFIHGIDPCTLEQTAAHEAGHIIVGHCIGETILKARLFCKKVHPYNFWVGFNERKYAGNAAFTVQGNPYLGFRAAINNLSGWTGELLAKLSHESSSIDEREMARDLVQTLDSVLGMVNGASAFLVTRICIECITKNRLQFDEIRLHLTRYRRLTKDEAKRMLIKATPYNIDAAFDFLKSTAS